MKFKSKEQVKFTTNIQKWAEIRMCTQNGKNYTRKITYKSVNQRIATTINNNMFYIQYNEIILEKNKKALKLKYESQF